MLPYDVERHLRLGRVSAVVPSPDGRWLAVAMSRLDSDEKKYVSDLWRVPLDGAAPSKLTHGDFDDRAPCFRRDGALGFLSRRPLKPGGKGDEGEDERAQVWVLPAGGGEAFALTDEPLGVSAFAFAEDADVLVVVADVLPGVPHEQQREAMRDRAKKGPSALLYTEMPVRFWDHWLEPAAPHYILYDDGGRRDLTPQADREYREMDWTLSRDGRLLVTATQGMADDRLFQMHLRVFDLVQGGWRDLPSTPRSEYARPRLSPDGRRVVARVETRQRKAVSVWSLELFDLETGTMTRAGTSADLDLLPQCWSVDGARIIATADQTGSVPVFAVSGDEVTRLTSTDAAGTHESVARIAGGDVLVGIRHTQLHPPEPFVLDGGGLRLAARLSGFGEEEAAFCARDRVQARATDGCSIDTLVLRPGEEARHPCLLWIHGGPVASWTDGWHWRWNPLVAVAHGYVVAMPNPRGSTGYGHAHVAGIWANTWGAACYEDVLAASDAMGALPYVDRERMGAMGGSFGGYMANWIGGNDPLHRYRCIVTHASVYNLSFFQAVTDWPAWLVHEFGLSPLDDVEAFERYSPHRFVSRWKTPVLVIHGEKDYRVPVSEGLALFEALQAHGTPSELLIFPDETHWIVKPRNIRAWYAHVFAFLERHLLAGCEDAAIDKTKEVSRR